MRTDGPTSRAPLARWATTHLRSTTRPSGVTAIGVLAILSGVLRLLGPLGIFGVVATGAAVDEPMTERLGDLATLFAVVSGVTGLVLLVTGVALLKIKPWAWTAAVAFAILALSAALAEFTLSLSEGWNWFALTSAVLPAVLLVYLSRPAVTDVFRKS